MMKTGEKTQNRGGNISNALREDWTDFVPSYYSYYDSFLRMRNERRKVKRQRRIFCVIMAALAAVIFNIYAQPADSKSEDKPMPIYRVNEGDTLWSIAREYKSDGVTTMEFVYDIKAANDMKSSALNVGELIMIPEC